MRKRLLQTLAWMIAGRFQLTPCSCLSMPSRRDLQTPFDDLADVQQLPLDSFTTSRRQFAAEGCCCGILTTTTLSSLLLFPSSATGIVSDNSSTSSTSTGLIRVCDPNTYEALVYSPQQQQQQPGQSSRSSNEQKLFPLLLVLHGAGRNDQDAWSLADMKGEHAGLVPSLLASGQAPAILAENFIVVAPYVGEGKRSFYEEPRSKILRFLDWFLSSDQGQAAGFPSTLVDRDRICLFGFSDGATVAVELATTQRFRAVVVAAYGFTGTLPALALQRLETIPIWVFHSADDVIFPVRCSDQLVSSLQLGRTGNNPGSSNRIRYSRYTRDPEGCKGSIEGHCVGITASKNADIYQWMLSVSSAGSPS